MTRTDAMLAIIEMARIGGAASPEDAVSHLATLIDRLDKTSLYYEGEVRLLLSIGATIWTLEHSPCACGRPR
ncbi:MAG: hypothetical protein PSV26_14855 [Polaromonas sp.]|uniref:hypothetical protein n=1 Tax=Polaromonas sp. TaxID=1869339 RepID=UPI002489B041|nr:hypothetical protein [Polaromonas sp.]MDI1238759.1 hypothetical protein [Polaromonas sp.]